MLNREKHQLIMGQILKDVSADISLAPLLGFKGGTSMYFFYGMPRFSVDLDFDLLSSEEADRAAAFEAVQKILKHYGAVKESRRKRYTIFFLLSYGEADRNIKLEISARTYPFNLRERYELKEYLGIPLLVAKKPYLFASKLCALTSRTETAPRDIYDIWFFAKNNWEIDEEVIKARTGKSTKEYLPDCIAAIERVKDGELLHGLGELVSEQEKKWIKENLRTETVFLLKNYLSVLK